MPNFVLHLRWLSMFSVALVMAFASLLNAEPPKGRLPVPDVAAQQKALATIREIYRDDYNSKDKTSLPEKLIQEAREAQDATDRFVLLWEGANTATEAFQGELAFQGHLAKWQASTRFHLHK